MDGDNGRADGEEGEDAEVVEDDMETESEGATGLTSICELNDVRPSISLP